MKEKIFLTGIQTTGTPHIGNYFGAIEPAIEYSKKYQAFYFMADYHSLNGIKVANEIRDSTYEIAATWLACGLNPEKTIFYKQSEVPQTFELATILSCFMPKGYLNRAHSYKDTVAKNIEAGKDSDDNINIGLFTYPVLMAADILLFNADIVPVGGDQKQHLEMTAEIARIINHTYSKELFTVPSAQIDEAKQVVGMDGRKMSKSYGNTIPLFLPSKKMRKQVMKIVTNSQAIDEPKDPEKCNVFAIYRLFSSKTEQENLTKLYKKGGMGWGEAKQILFEKMEEVLSPMRKKYDEIVADRDYIDRILAEDAQRAIPIAEAHLKELRRAVGVRR